ncbi:MAG TPA: hypothetical protein V6C71_06040 [Coleofasciculaceae cyanobacterium]|jgi:hypothetical protein
MLHRLRELIIEQYSIIDFLGEGLGGTTHKALDLKSNNYVAVKVLLFQQPSNWKIIDLNVSSSYFLLWFVAMINFNLADD